MRLGNIAAIEGRSDDALAAYAEAAAVAETLGGPAHYRMSLALGASAQVRFDRGDLDGAEAEWSRALEIRRRVLPPEHASIGWVLFRLGRVAAARGDRATARARFTAALPILVAANDAEQAAQVRAALAALRAPR
jgi:tetratricopeptide (TPR) repeat protein